MILLAFLFEFLNSTVGNGIYDALCLLNLGNKNIHFSECNILEQKDTEAVNFLYYILCRSGKIQYNSKKYETIHLMV